VDEFEKKLIWIPEYVNKINPPVKLTVYLLVTELLIHTERAVITDAKKENIGEPTGNQTNAP